MKRLGLCAWIFLAVCGAPGQQAPQLSPQAAFDEAAKPIEIVHRSIGNWSETEAGSLAVAIKKAADACSARKAADYVGESLIAFGRLCSLGQNWPAVSEAGSRYIDSADAAKPQLAIAYALKVDAVAHLLDERGIVTATTAMLGAVPYDDVVDGSFAEALNYLQLAFTKDALRLLELREPLVLAELGKAKPAVARPVLYADGLAMAALQQYAGKPEDAAATAGELACALMSGSPTQDERLLIAEQDRGYALLGKPMPQFTATASLLDANAKVPAIDPEQGASTAFLLFPPWCAQCVRMASADLNDAVITLGRGALRVYALLAETMPDAKTLATGKDVTTALLHTPTLVVPPATLQAYAANDFPWLVVVDHAGIVRFAQVAPETALKRGEFVFRVTDYVAEAWPSRKFIPVPAPAAAPAPAPAPAPTMK